MSARLLGYLLLHYLYECALSIFSLVASYMINQESIVKASFIVC